MKLAIIAVPYDEVPKVVQECGEAGVKGIVVATAGYADDGERGLARQRELVRQARANGMRVIGPASLGIVNTNPAVSLNASMAPSLARRGGLGLFSQSAAIGVSLYAASSRRRVGISTFLSAGNRADVSGNDLMQYWEDDADTTAVGLYLESIGNPRKFSRLARRLARTKPVIVAKSDAMGLNLPPGHSVRTTQAPPEALDAMMRQAGVIRVGTIEELMDVAQIVSSQPLPAGPWRGRVQQLPGPRQGGLGQRRGRRARRRADRRRRRPGHRHVPCPPGAAPQPAGDPDAGERARRRRGPAAVPGADRGEDRRRTGRMLGRRRQTRGGRVHRHPGPRHHVEGMVGDAGEAPAGALLLEPGRRRRRPGRRRPLRPVEGPGPGPLRRARGLRRPTPRTTTSTNCCAPSAASSWSGCDPAAADRLLGHYGIHVLPSAGFETDDDAIAAADRLGWPVAIKTTDPALRHRLDLGGVRLDIQDADSLRANIAQMRRSLRRYGSPSLEVQAMAPVGQACTFRAIEDPLLGPVVSFGLAGDAVNLLDDWAHRCHRSPLGRDDFIRAPRASRKLFGYQGLPAVDVAALEDLAARLTRLKDNHPEIALVEFNPVLAGTEGAVILAADVRIANAAQRTDTARRAMRA